MSPSDFKLGNPGPGMTSGKDAVDFDDGSPETLSKKMTRQNNAAEKKVFSTLMLSI